MDITNLHDFSHLKDYFDVLRRRRDIIVIFLLATVVLVAAGSFIMRPVYRARAVLMIDVESPNVLTTSGAVELGYQNYYSYKDYLQTQMEVITSRPIIQEVFRETGLAKSREYAKAKDPIKNFSKTISVEPLRDTRLIELRVDNKDPALAANIANRIAELYVSRNLTYISKNELLNLLKNEYLKLQSKLSEYTNIYKEDHPEMIKLRQEIKELVDKIEQERKIISTYGVQNTLAQTSAYAGTLEGLKANNVNIIEPAERPKTPIKPRKALNLILAFLFGSFGGVGLAFFLEYLDDTVKDVEEVEKLTGLPILGNVPEIGGQNKLGEFEKDIFVHTNPKDPISEAYRTFRTNIFFSSTEERKLRSVLITSPGPGEGKTITFSNLSIAVAQNGKRVLMVDADMRKPRLNEIFKKQNKVGLGNFLCGQAEFESVIQKTGIDNLFLVTSGPIPPNPAELLSSGKLKEFAARAIEEFDLVIFDSPPFALLTDAAIISRATDGMILVIESGKTSRRALVRISKLLKDAGIRVVGAFLNKIGLTNKNYYYYSYYYNRYGKEEGETSAKPEKGIPLKSRR